MTKVLCVLLTLGTIILSCSDKVGDKKTLSSNTKAALLTELKQMVKRDQLHRTYISIGTLDQSLIDSIRQLPTIDQIKFRQKHPTELSKREKDSLWAIQRKIDLENTDRLYKIVKEYGWLNKTALDSVIDPMIFLFHTPKETIEKMQKLLLGEVKEKRMEPLLYATYVDNMRKKALGKNQLYGTGDEFDSVTNSILPPFIENIEITNQERKKIGLPALKQGKYRTER